jgi:hypothetical protein
MDAIRSAFRVLIVSFVLPALAGCSGVGVGWLGSNSGPAQPAGPSAPPVNLAGIWLFSSPGRGQCRMTFGTQPNAVDGTIAPQGGCPGKFYMSRKWTFEGGSLVMRDHNGQPLAQLESQGATFEGKATTGEAVTLMR